MSDFISSDLSVANQENTLSNSESYEFDRRYVWHPYAPVGSRATVKPVVTGAHGPYLELDVPGLLTDSGREEQCTVIDGMSSWWAAIHGYCHPRLDEAVIQQVKQFSHVMFGGLTHQPALALTQRLLQVLPEGLERIFYCDSGSVSVEVAVKMALQFWRVQGKNSKTQLITWRGGYHGDTFTPMSVCDPEGGMHSLWTGLIQPQIFADVPPAHYTSSYSEHLEHVIATHCQDAAAVIIEPLVQGAGGMRFHHPQYLADLRQLCDRYEVLLICDEIATGFGRTGEFFAVHHGNISPDIMCIGKAITGGYMSFAATVCTEEIGDVLSTLAPGSLMHGPTFMGNPLACSCAIASFDELMESQWQEKVSLIEEVFKSELVAGCKDIPNIVDVRVLGAIGVIEMDHSVDMVSATRTALKHGVWLRPFGSLIYSMPPYILQEDQLVQVAHAMREVAYSQRID